LEIKNHLLTKKNDKNLKLVAPNLEDYFSKIKIEKKNSLIAKKLHIYLPCN
jgi:hypothetical protein